MKISQEKNIDFFPFFKNVKQQIIVIIIFCFALNINTLKNENAFDDDMVIVKNIYVQQGLSGIWKIFSKESFRGYCEYKDVYNTILGGRYRPLSIVSFAIEQELFGKTLGQEYLDAKKERKNLQNTNAPQIKISEAEAKVEKIDSEIINEAKNLSFLRHLFQIIFFTFSMIILFWFLNFYLFPKQNSIAFIATLLFVSHPVHAEVIANIKSRDEIFSLLFILLTFIFIYKHNKLKDAKTLLFGCLSFFCALLSKEYAVILPLIILAGISISYQQKIIDVIKSKWFLFFLAIDGFFILMRENIVGRAKSSLMLIDVFDNPFLYANLQQKIATKIQILSEYLRILFFPYKLSYDYSYNHFPYLTFLNLQVWFSLFIWLFIIVVTVKLWQKTHVLSFALILFLGFFMLVNNIFFNIGATMGERLIYHSSLGFFIIIAWFIIYLFEQIKLSHQVKIILANTFLLAIFLLLGFKTISRNAIWKNNFTLFTHDVKVVPNSALANGNAGSAFLNRGTNLNKNINEFSHTDSINMIAYADTALPFFNKAISIYPKYFDAYINRARCYLNKSDLKRAVEDWKTAALISKGRNPTLVLNAKLLLYKSNELYKIKDYKNALSLLRDAILIDDGNVEIWLTLGGVDFLLGNFEEAVNALNKAVELNPSSEETQQGLAVAKGLLQLKQKCMNDSMNLDIWLVAAKAYSQNGITSAAIEAYKKALHLSPKNKVAINGLKELENH